MRSPCSWALPRTRSSCKQWAEHRGSESRVKGGRGGALDTSWADSLSPVNELNSTYKKAESPTTDPSSTHLLCLAVR